MTTWWWTCPRCFDRMTPRHTEAEAIVDRDAHLANQHPEVVYLSAAQMAIYHYNHLEVHP